MELPHLPHCPVERSRRFGHTHCFAGDDARPIVRRVETAGEIEMAMRMKQVLYSAVALCALAGALYVPASAAGLNIETATIADLNAAFAGGHADFLDCFSPIPFPKTR